MLPEPARRRLELVLLRGHVSLFLFMLMISLGVVVVELVLLRGHVSLFLFMMIALGVVVVVVLVLVFFLSLIHI